MSQYLLRYVEQKYEEIDGQSWHGSDMPDDAPDGSIWRVNQKRSSYWRFDGKRWDEAETVTEEEKEHAKFVQKRVMLPTENIEAGTVYGVRQEGSVYYKRTNGEWKPVPSETIKRGWRLLKTYSIGLKGSTYSDWRKQKAVIDSKEVTLLETDGWCNNGGNIRDDYINNDYSIADCHFAERGFPEDISPETLAAITDENGKTRGYHRTWVTVDEWRDLYESEEARFLTELKEAYMKRMTDGVVKRLDYIIANMKDPLGAQKPNFDEEEEDEYDAVDEIISENMTRLYLIAEEIAKADLIAEQNGLYSTSDIRIIYFIE